MALSGKTVTVVFRVVRLDPEHPVGGLVRNLQPTVYSTDSRTARSEQDPAVLAMREMWRAG